MALCLLDREADPTVQRHARAWLEGRPPAHTATVTSLVDPFRSWCQLGQAFFRCPPVVEEEATITNTDGRQSPTVASLAFFED